MQSFLCISPVPDPMAWKQDAFHHPWNNLSSHTFPHFAFLRQLLSRVTLLGNLSLVVVAVLWPQKKWLSGNTCPRHSSTSLGYPIYSFLWLRGRNRCPETPFRFGFDWSSAMCTSLPPIRIADQLGFRHLKSGSLRLHSGQEELCSSASIEGWNLVISEHLCSLLPLRCHSPAYGHLYWPCGDGSRGHVAH